MSYLDPPGAPGKPEPVDWNKDFVDLKWKEPKDNGGAAITGYIIEKREQGTTKFFKAAEIKGMKVTFANLIVEK